MVLADGRTMLKVQPPKPASTESDIVVWPWAVGISIAGYILLAILSA
jgi:hypothetical protein